MRASWLEREDAPRTSRTCFVLNSHQNARPIDNEQTRRPLALFFLDKTNIDKPKKAQKSICYYLQWQRKQRLLPPPLPLFLWKSGNVLQPADNLLQRRRAAVRLIATGINWLIQHHQNSSCCQAVNIKKGPLFFSHSSEATRERKSEPPLWHPSTTYFIHFAKITAVLQTDMDEECEMRALDFFFFSLYAWLKLKCQPPYADDI